MDKPRRICFVTPFAYPLLVDGGSGAGGAERQFFLFGRELIKIGWRVTFITDKPRNQKLNEETIMPVYFASFSYLGGSKWKTMHDWIELWNAMAKANSTYYVLKTPAHLLIPLGLFCHIHRKKLVFWGQTSHDASKTRHGINKLGSIMQNIGMKAVNIVIAQTADQKKGFEINYGMKSIIVPSIAAILEESYFQENKNIAKEKKIDVLWVGNSMTNKQYEVVMELAELLPKRTFAIAMNKSDSSRFHQAEDKAKNLSNVIFLGTLAPIQMESWFKKTKLFLNTSIREGFPNTFLQSWMNRVPVISLNIDPDGIIKRYNLGRIIDSGELQTNGEDFKEKAGMLVQYVVELLENEAVRLEIGENAIRYVNKNHSSDVAVPKLIAALEQYENK
jgi:glycosyltransferase involved in cell wall biosynthesis